MTVTANMAGTGNRYSYHVDLTIQVSDDAEIASSTSDIRSEQSEYSPTGRRFVSVSIPASGEGRVDRGSGKVSEEYVNQTVSAGLAMGSFLADSATRGAKEKWQGGG